MARNQDLFDPRIAMNATMVLYQTLSRRPYDSSATFDEAVVDMFRIKVGASSMMELNVRCAVSIRSARTSTKKSIWPWGDKPAQRRPSSSNLQRTCDPPTFFKVAENGICTSVYNLV